MPNTKSAIKANRQNATRRAKNLKILTQIRITVKKAKKLHAAGNDAEAEKMLRAAFSALDKAAKKGVIHKNKASRLKSRISKKKK